MRRLERLKVKENGSHRNWESFKKALRASWSQEGIKELQAQLNDIRSEIEFRVLLSYRGSLKTIAMQQAQTSHQLSQSTRSIISTFLTVRDEFANELQRQAEKLAELQGYKDRAGAEAHGTFQTLRHQDDDSEGHKVHETSAAEVLVEHEMIQLIIENGILGTLDFQCSHDRHEDVEIAHHQTFEWIYREAQKGDKSWSNFAQWLRQDDGLYWINGKAGSGKSTLMKYIYGHPKTRQELQKWAGAATFNISGFFFWNSGLEEQRSQRGLLRTLLFETLQTLRDLIPKVLPHLWDSWCARVKTGIKLGTAPAKASLFAHEAKHWTLSQLKQAFRQLIRECQSSKIKLCFFIDGLDEYDGDHDEIVEYFLSFAHDPGIKMCVSSRPLVVFEEAFAAFPCLKLQNLTYTDIKLYVEDKLGNHRHMARLSLKNPEEANGLTTEIVAKASGVFLWVKLVVKSLLQGLRDQNRITDLRRRLRHLPADLEALYEHMLLKTDPFYLEQASQIFQIVLVAQKESTSRQITLLQLSWAEDEDETLAINASLRVLLPEDIAGRCKLMDSRLKSVCSGLLESYDSRYSGIAPDARVVFLHRTVSDFFKRRSIWEMIIKHTHGTDFCPHLSLLRSSILQLKGQRTHASNPLDMSIIRDALKFAKKVDDMGLVVTTLLDQLDVAATYQWRMSNGSAINGRIERKTTASRRDLNRTVLPKLSQCPSGRTIDSESDSDDYYDCRSDDDSRPKEATSVSTIPRTPALPVTGSLSLGLRQPEYLSTSFPIGLFQNTLTDNAKTTRGGGLKHWTDGIEIEGAKAYNQNMSFYDLAKALDLKQYITSKDLSGLVVDHDVNHHMLMHAITCYARNKEGQSKVPDPAIVQRALEAGADPNFAFYGDSAWEEALAGAFLHLSNTDFDEELSNTQSPKYRQWLHDATIWADIMKTFLGHGANPSASSKQHWGGPRRKPLQIVQKFPADLKPHAESITVMLGELLNKSMLKNAEFLEQEEKHVHFNDGDVFLENEKRRSLGAVTTTYQWVVSWFTVGGGK